MINAAHCFITKNKLLVIVVFFLSLYGLWISIYDHWTSGEQMPVRNANKETILDIEKCIEGEADNLLLYSVVNQSPISDRQTNETVDYAAQIAERLASKGYDVHAFNRRYEDLATIFGGIRVHSSATTSITEIFIGNNSSSGTQVTCIPDSLRIGFDALDVGMKSFNTTKNGTSVEGEIKIGEDSPASNKTFYFGTAMPPGQAPHPGAGVY
jgi:hypothetical protein